MVIVKNLQLFDWNTGLNNVENNTNQRLRRAVLHNGERELMAQLKIAIAASSSQFASDLGRQLEEHFQRLTSLWDAICEYPSVYSSQSLGTRTRDIHTMIDSLASCEPYTIETCLPTRATLSMGFSTAKFNFSRMVCYIIEELNDESIATQFKAEAQRMLHRSIGMLIAEDLLRSIARDDKLSPLLRRNATMVLVQIWEHRATIGLEDFFPMLESVWEARNHITVNYGTLMGFSEMFQLMQAGCDPEFIEYFTRDLVTEDEKYALMEFVFNATYEEIRVMRAYMEENKLSALTPQQVAKIFDVSLDRLHRQIITPRDMFFTFREREMWARHRRFSNLPGPKRTAEAYFLIYLLNQTDLPAINGVHFPR